MKAIDKVLLKNRKTPLLIGSVKSNMGHSLGCANFCALIKVLLAFQEGSIPPNLYFDKPSQTIPALIENRAKVNFVYNFHSECICDYIDNFIHFMYQ